MYYNHVKDATGQSLSFITSEGQTKVVTESHPHFATILVLVSQLDVDEQAVLALLNLGEQVAEKLTSLSERVSYAGNSLFFDGDPLDETLASHILRLVRENNDDYVGLVNFLEKMSTNPSVDSQKSLYSWLKDRDFTITSEGDFLAYKGVKVGSNDESLSINSGTATVDGVSIKGNIPNPIGGVIEMPRSKVDADVATGCSTGLHAGTWDYAHSFAQGRTLVVKINPRDVVSVPSDCEFQKLRVSRYVVLEAKDQPYTAPTWDEYDDEDECYECGDSECEGECETNECDSCDEENDQDGESSTCSTCEDNHLKEANIAWQNQFADRARNSGAV